MLAIGLYLFQGGLEVVRSQVLVRIASRLDRQLTTMTHDAVIRLRSFVGSQANPMQPLRDVDAIRNFPFRTAPVAILDMPWMPLYLAFVFLLHSHSRLGHFGWRPVPDLAHVSHGTVDARTNGGVFYRLAATLDAGGSFRANAEVLNAMGFAHRSCGAFNREPGLPRRQRALERHRRQPDGGVARVSYHAAIGLAGPGRLPDDLG